MKHLLHTIYYLLHALWLNNLYFFFFVKDQNSKNVHPRSWYTRPFAVKSLIDVYSECKIMLKCMYQIWYKFFFGIFIYVSLNHCIGLNCMFCPPKNQNDRVLIMKLLNIMFLRHIIGRLGLLLWQITYKYQLSLCK